MSSSVLEKTRAVHEDIEKYEQAIVETLDENPKTQKEKVLQQHRIVHYLDKVQECANNAIELYTDKDGLRAKEIEDMSTGDFFKTFYTRLEDIQKYYVKYPDLIEEPVPLDEISEELPFSGEEYWGKYLDLHELFDLYVNLPNIDRVDYITYLSVFYQFENIPMKTRWESKYSQYIDSLYTYIHDYFVRTQPLLHLNNMISEYKQKFEEVWTKGELPGWTILVNNKRDLSIYKSVEEIEQLGLEECKNILTELGLKCGGTIKQRAERIFSVKDLKVTDIPLELFAGSKKNKKKTETKEEKSFESLKPLAEQEFLISSLVQEINDVLANTQIYVEKKSVQNYEERQMEEEEQEKAEAQIAQVQDQDIEEEEEENGAIQNPKNLPLGPDGKPVPLWLVKLYGLKEEFPCEICGNQIYMGRRAYELHFQEFKHAHGMKCLGIPNTKHFFGITSIKDAQNLYAKLRNQIQTEDWTQDDEEFEDHEGNILSKKTYNDLLRQGLL
ncbi:hypothetical protein WA158_000323 [Blastocystis sp. Blastoise]